MNVIDLLQREQEKQEVPVLRTGDTVRVHVKVVEGTRERIQVFEGIVISLKGSHSLDARFTVRRITHGVGVERTFLLHSPRIDRVDVLRHGAVRRAKLFYLRDKIGKNARIRELRTPLGGSATTRLSASATAALAASQQDQPTVEDSERADAGAVPAASTSVEMGGEG